MTPMIGKRRKIKFRLKPEIAAANGLEPSTWSMYRDDRGQWIGKKAAARRKARELRKEFENVAFELERA